MPVVSQYKVYRHEAWSHPVLQYTEMVWDAHMLAAPNDNEDIFGRPSGPLGAEDDVCQVRSHVKIINTVECHQQTNEGSCQHDSWNRMMCTASGAFSKCIEHFCMQTQMLQCL